MFMCCTALRGAVLYWFVLPCALGRPCYTKPQACTTRQRLQRLATAARHSKETARAARVRCCQCRPHGQVARPRLRTAPNRAASHHNPTQRRAGRFTQHNRRRSERPCVPAQVARPSASPSVTGHSPLVGPPVASHYRLHTHMHSRSARRIVVLPSLFLSPGTPLLPC